MDALRGLCSASSSLQPLISGGAGQEGEDTSTLQVCRGRSAKKQSCCKRGEILDGLWLIEWENTL